jgi:hypothetical protein
MDAEDERRQERIRENERRWEGIREQNRLEEEATHQQHMAQQEFEAYYDSLATGDYSGWHRVIGRLPQESAQGIGSGSGSGSSVYEPPVHSYVLAVRTALNGANRVPPVWRDRWLSNLGLIKPEKPQNALITVQGIIREVTDMRDHFRPRRQGMDLDLSLYQATVAYDAQIQAILDQLQQLRAHLASTAS